jgi:hypothetical protein
MDCERRAPELGDWRLSLTLRFRRLTTIGALAFALALPAAARAQEPSTAEAAKGAPSTADTPDEASAPSTASAATVAQAEDDDTVFRPAEPDFTLVSLPTGLPVAKFKSAFRVTHRFTRPLGQGDFGDLAADAFGIDSGARIGLEYRFGIIPHGQIGIHRTSDRTIEFFGQYELLRQGQKSPFAISALVSVDGTNNFKDEYSPAAGAILSWTHAEHVALYVEPIWVGNTNLFDTTTTQDNTFMVGIGARVRIRPTVYLVGEASPRASGYKPGVNHGSFAIEKRAGGHVFQLNFSDSFGTTMAQIARGGPASKDWFMGFNISRKFY